MAFFHYRAFTAQGDLSQGEIEARNREEAEEAVWGWGSDAVRNMAGEIRVEIRLFSSAVVS